jgi:hypothetical protein
MVEGLLHRARIQLERDEKSTNFTKNQSHLPAVVSMNTDLF